MSKELKTRAMSNEPCRALWQAVILRAVADAISGGHRNLGFNRGNRQLAVSWLFDDIHKTDRDIVFDLAEMPRVGWQKNLMRLIKGDGVKCSNKSAITAANKYFLRNAEA